MNLTAVSLLRAATGRGGAVRERSARLKRIPRKRAGLANPVENEPAATFPTVIQQVNLPRAVIVLLQI
jgi:hypothetical protein